jgi:hypothetical protein
VAREYVEGVSAENIRNAIAQLEQEIRTLGKCGPPQ